MAVLFWILFGLVAGGVARLVVRGTGGIGCIGTVVVGIVGALIGGLIGEVVLGQDVDFGWDVGPFLLAVVGAIAFLLLLRAVGGRRS